MINIIINYTDSHANKNNEDNKFKTSSSPFLRED